MSRTPRLLLIGMLDLLLLLPAALLVLGEHVLWQGARVVLRAVTGLPLIRALHLWLGLLLRMPRSRYS